MTSEAAPSPDLTTDPALAVAERQLVMLEDLARMAMVVSQAFASSAVASAEAEKAILADDYFIPEVGRARACGAKDAAESFQKVTRSARLTLMLELKVAETVRDLRAGTATHGDTPLGSKTAAETPAVLVTTDADRPLSAGPCSDKQDTDVTRADSDTERLVDIEFAERLPKGSYRGLVDNLAADIGASIDWTSATVSAPNLGRILPPRHPLKLRPDPHKSSCCPDVARRDPGIEPRRHKEREDVRAERGALGERAAVRCLAGEAVIKV